MELFTSLQIFATRLKLKVTILPMELLINIAPIVQPTLLIDQGTTVSDMPTPDLGDPGAGQLTVPSITHPTATAMVALQSISDCQHWSGLLPQSSGILLNNSP